MVNPATEPAIAGAIRRSSAGRVVAFLVGLALLAAAIFMLGRNGGALQQAARSLAAAPPWLILVAALLPLASLGLTSITFFLLMNRYGRVGLGEMAALIGAAWLLNYLPLWPGMFGRVAYHRAVNGIPITCSATALIWANLLTGAAAAVVGCITLLGSIVFPGDDWRLALAVAVPAPVIALVSFRVRGRTDLPDPHLWRLLAALAVRLVEVQVWAARYAACFALVGVPIAWGAALALAAAAQLATLVPVGGNALGWREWITGVLTPLLPVGLSLTTAASLQTGLTADLAHRAIEVALAAVVGLACAAWVARRVRAAGLGIGA